MLEIGQVFQEKYKIEKILGQGGMGKVYLASHITLGTKWAIKETKKSSEVDLLAEPAILKKLNNPRIPRIIDIFEDDEHLYIVEDFIDGITLSNVIEAKKTIPEKQVIAWALELCDILTYLHSAKPNPIIYRDLKPENIMISDKEEIKLIDFGIAREYKNQKSDDTQKLGSPGYTEFFYGQSDERTDIFSLGVIMHQMLTGVNPRLHPYENDPVRTFNSKLSPGIEKIVAKCTNKNRNNRFKTAEELKKALLNIDYINSEEYKVIRKRRIRIAAFLIILILCFSIVGIAFNLERRNKSFNTAISKGNDYLNAMDYAKAEAEVETALSYDSKNIKVYELLASIYNAQGSYDEVLKVIERCKENNIELSEKLYVYYGSAIYDKGNFKGAREAYEKALSINKDNIEAKANIAVCYAKENDNTKAMEVLNELKSKNVDKYFIAFTEGEILYSLGDFIKSEENLKAALSERPQDFKVLTKLSDTLMKQKKYTEAIEYLNKASSVSPHSLKILDGLASASFNLAINDADEEKKQNYLKESLNYYKQKEELGDNSTDNKLNMGIVSVALGNYDEAVKFLTEASTMNPKDTSSLRYLGIVYTDKKDYAKAKDYFNKILVLTSSGDDYSYAKEQLEVISKNGW